MKLNRSMMNVNDQDFQSNAFYHQHDFQCCLAIMYLIVGSLSDSFMFPFHQSVLIIKNSLLTLLCNLCLFQVTSESVKILHKRVIAFKLLYLKIMH